MVPVELLVAVEDFDGVEIADEASAAAEFFAVEGDELAAFVDFRLSDLGLGGGLLAFPFSG